MYPVSEPALSGLRSSGRVDAHGGRYSLEGDAKMDGQKYGNGSVGAR